MFNASNGRQVITDKIDGLTDRFAAEFEDRMTGLSLTQQENLVNRLLEVVSNKDTTSAFVAGTYAQNSQGQPAAALGTGSGERQPATEQEALAFLLASGSLPSGVKQALKRLLYPQDPAHIRVGADGTPEEVGHLRQQLASKDAELREERDPAKVGSLAHKLAAAAPTNLVKKADVRALLDQVPALVDAVKSPTMSNKVAGLDAVKAKVAEVARMVS